MTDKTTPTTPTTNAVPAAPAQSKPGKPPHPAQARPPEPSCNLLAGCVECGQGIELPLPIDQRELSYMLAQVGWFISVLKPPGAAPGARMVIGPLCAPCAGKVYPPEVFAVADQRRRQLLTIVQPPTPQAERTPAFVPIAPTPGAPR